MINNQRIIIEKYTKEYDSFIPSEVVNQQQKIREKIIKHQERRRSRMKRKKTKKYFMTVPKPVNKTNHNILS